MAGKQRDYSTGQLTLHEQQVLDFVARFKQLHGGCAPSIEEIMAACTISSKSVVRHYLLNLKKMGYISYPPGRARMIHVRGMVCVYEAEL